jgi:hypothetical protein
MLGAAALLWDRVGSLQRGDTELGRILKHAMEGGRI